jgi:hypothetical protein
MSSMSCSESGKRCRIALWITVPRITSIT